MPSAVRAAADGERGTAGTFLWLTTLGGLVFLGMQAYEWLFNIVKHARAGAVGVAVSRAGGIGLFSARERLALLGGRLGSTMKVLVIALWPLAQSRICMSPKTVATHREHLMDKLHIRSIAGLTKYAVQQGLTSSEPELDD